MRSSTPSYSLCEWKSCDRPLFAKGLCNAHYLRKMNGSNMDAPMAPFTPRFCDIEGCEELHQAHGYCARHNYKYKKYGDPLAGGRYAPAGSGHVTKNGYHTSQQGDVRRLTHRVVMEEILGRPLLPGETVHHKNGIRSDNRPENLELRAHNHGPGQTIPDLLAWAHEIIERYGEWQDVAA